MKWLSVDHVKQMLEAEIFWLEMLNLDAEIHGNKKLIERIAWMISNLEEQIEKLPEYGVEIA